MTISRPKVVGYLSDDKHLYDCVIFPEDYDPLIRMADYETLQAECEKLRAAIRRLCNIYVVDDYYDGQLREERLDRAVNRAINAAMQEPTQ